MYLAIKAMKGVNDCNSCLNGQVTNPEGDVRWQMMLGFDLCLIHLPYPSSG